jgi:hypothetical protein
MGRVYSTYKESDKNITNIGQKTIRDETSKDIDVHI